MRFAFAGIWNAYRAWFFILMAAFILFLLPFSLANYGCAQHGQAAFTAPLVIGLFLFIIFAAWETWLARTHFIPYQLFKDRTVFGACGLSAILHFCFYSWDLCLFITLSLMTLGTDLMIHFRRSDSDIGSMMMSQILIAFAGGGFVAQMKYLPGTKKRDAINLTYGYSQKYGCIAATAILVLAVPCIGMWRHYRVDKEQNKGTIL
ncbi:hypothetical protein PITC_061920 [Penicillium italicum]|uniref:Major facilitator superfamily domain, general substrate transporter n=1 Tax=Penicillium italicum TaxID=40296 RepID=A0A0A2KYV4_PENIT|nr:hypothetical protein PITC_061920 [Penicillium italicum]